MKPQEYGQVLQVKIVKAIDIQEDKIYKDP